MGKAERTKQLIIEKAAVIFNEKGIGAASMDEIIKSARIGKGCLYNHFESKEVLASESVDYLLRMVSDKRDEVLAKEKTAKNKLFAYMSIYKNPLITLIDGGCPVLNLSVESDDTNQIVRRKVRIVIDKTVKLITKIVEDGIAQQEFSDKVIPEEFAIKLFSSIEGTIAISRVMNNMKPMTTLIKNLKQEIEEFSLEIPVIA